MEAERLTSRKNRVIARFRVLADDAALRHAEGEYVCDGGKLLTEALDKGAAITQILWKERAQDLPGLEEIRQYVAPSELFDYASPMKNSPGPLFSLRMPEPEMEPRFSRALLLENVQDPGNVGTLIRTAAAMGVDTVLLCGACADVYSPKTARATMGAIFRERLVHTDLNGAKALCEANGLPLYGAALSERASDIRSLDLCRAVVAIGSEGRGLSRELLALCDGELIIPMSAGSESLNAASAGTIVLWEMARARE